ncbi:MAG: hypothetical protein MJ133_09105 [Lachnospiraceae bacterium]|nr:hypothetical protein [Lachnospiraceae bacterium]
MADKADLIIGGYFFGSYDDAKKAEKEMKNANYLEERVGSMSPKQLLGLYDKMIDEKVFETPVGWEYLKYLRSSLISKGIDEELIRPIPLRTIFVTKEENDYSHIAKLYVKPAKNEKNKLKRNLMRSVVVNVLLAVLVIAMFIIALKSPSPNILNYKQVITDNYAAWEQELTEREAAVREKEKQYENLGG